MASFLFGLVCLCILSVEGIKGVGNDVLVSRLFSWIAGQSGDNDTIELNDMMIEFKQIDLSRDGYLSITELRARLQELNLSSSYAEIIFGAVYIVEEDLKARLKAMDASGDEYIDQSEFKSYYTRTVIYLDSLDVLGK